MRETVKFMKANPNEYIILCASDFIIFLHLMMICTGFGLRVHLFLNANVQS